MGITLILLGVGCIIGAIVGGGIKLSHLEIPKFGSVWRQFILALFGLLILVLGIDAHLSEPAQGGQTAEKQDGKNQPPAQGKQEVTAAKVEQPRRTADEEDGSVSDDEEGSPEPAPSGFVGAWRDNYGNAIRFVPGTAGLVFRADTAEGQSFVGVAAVSGRTMNFTAGSLACELSLSAGDDAMEGGCFDMRNGQTEPARLVRL